jgi:hypothetical protein
LFILFVFSICIYSEFVLAWAPEIRIILLLWPFGP